MKSARVVLGHVAPIPWGSPEAAQALVGKTITPDTAMAAANAAVAQAKPLSHNKYKITLTKVAVKRAILKRRRPHRRCRMMILPDPERFDTSCEDLCPALRWKEQFIGVEHDPTVPPTNDGLFWCMHTQTCIGPDGTVGRAGQLLVIWTQVSRNGEVWVKVRTRVAMMPPAPSAPVPTGRVRRHCSLRLFLTVSTTSRICCITSAGSSI